MAETKRMTAEEVVGYLLEGEGLDVVRESLVWICEQLMEAEVSELIGAERGERAPGERLTHRNGYRPRRWDTRAGELELAIPKMLFRGGNRRRCCLWLTGGSCVRLRTTVCRNGRLGPPGPVGGANPPERALRPPATVGQDTSSNAPASGGWPRQASDRRLGPRGLHRAV